MKEIEPKRSAASWLAELAKGRYGEYALSVLTALLGVACSLIPYFIIIRLITALVNGMAELTYCLTLCAWMAGFWVLRYVLHSVSTCLLYTSQRGYKRRRSNHHGRLYASQKVISTRDRTGGR